MNIFSEIKNLEAKHIGLYGAAFMATVAPGFLMVFHFHRELIERYDILKLTFFSISLTLPVVALNLLVFGIVNGEQIKWKPKKEVNPSGLATFALVASSMVYYLALILSYYFSISFKFFVGVAFLLEAVIIAFSIADVRTSRKRVKSSPSPN